MPKKKKNPELVLTFKTAYDLMKERETLKRISTDTPIDELIGGGIEEGEVIEFYGEYGSGKTQIAKTLATIIAGEQKQQVVFVDCEETFKPERIMQIAKNRGLDPELTLKNIHVLIPPTTNELVSITEKLPEGVTPKLLIIDGLTTLFRVEYIGRETLTERQGHLRKFLYDLKRWAKQTKTVVVVTNQVYADAAASPFMPLEYKELAVGGHCLSPSTLVYTPKGVLPIQSIPNPEATLYTLDGWGTCTYKTSVNTTSAIVINDELICSPDHTLFKYDKCIRQPCKANDVRLGDWLLIASKVDFEGEDISLPKIDVKKVYIIKNPQLVREKLKEKGLTLKNETDVSILGVTPRHLRRILNQNCPTTLDIVHAIEDFIGEKVDVEEVGLWHSAAREHKNMRLPNYLDEKMAQIFGYWLGDGERTLQNNTITIKDSREEVIRFYANLIESLFNVKSRVKHVETVTQHGDTSFYQLWASNKYVASLFKWLLGKYTIISKAKREVIKGFLRGLFDAECGTGKSIISVLLKDYELLQFVKMLLLRLGIASSIRRSGKYFVLRICTFHIDTFMSEVGLTAMDKIQKVPLGIKRRQVTFRLLDNGYLLRRVDKIERKTINEDFIDITVLPQQNFVANGYIVHNSLYHAIDNRIFVRKAQGGTRIAKLVDSSMHPPAERPFKITEKGVEAVPKPAEAEKQPNSESVTKPEVIKNDGNRAY